MARLNTFNCPPVAPERPWAQQAPQEPALHTTVAQADHPEPVPSAAMAEESPEPLGVPPEPVQHRMAEAAAPRGRAEDRMVQGLGPPEAQAAVPRDQAEDRTVQALGAWAAQALWGAAAAAPAGLAATPS